MKQNITVIASNGKKDAMLNKLVYFIYCLVGLSIVYRIFLNRRVPFVEHYIHKKIYIDSKKKLSDYLANDAKSLKELKPEEKKGNQEKSDKQDKQVTQEKINDTQKQDKSLKHSQTTVSSSSETTNQTIKKQKTSKK